jgi:hypothetical protein
MSVWQDGVVCLACIGVVGHTVDVGYNVRVSCLTVRKFTVSEAKWMAPKSKIHHSHSLQNGLRIAICCGADNCLGHQH